MNISKRGQRRITEAIRRTDRATIRKPIRQHAPAEIKRGLIAEGGLGAPASWGLINSCYMEIWEQNQLNTPAGIAKTGDRIIVVNDDPSLKLPAGTPVKVIFTQLGWEILWASCASYADRL